MNYYKQFAEMLGLELEQEFVLTDDDGNRKDQFTYKITEDGFLSKPQASVNWSVMSVCTFTIVNLLSGNIKAVPKSWKPKKGDEYWRCSSKCGKVSSTIWLDDVIDICGWKSGNCFRTEEEANTKGKEIMEKLVKEYEEA